MSDVQSQPVKRVVSCALAASAVVAVVTFQSPATASPNPAPQTPPAAQQPAPPDALEKYYEPSERAEKPKEEHLQAPENPQAQQTEPRQTKKQQSTAHA